MSLDTRAAQEPAGPPPSLAHQARVEWAPVPRVNLLPPEVLADRRFRRLQRQLAGGVLAMVVLCVVATLWAQSGVASAQEDLAATRAQGVALQRQQDKYAEAPKALAELDAARASRESALGTDVSWYLFLNDLAVNTPLGTELASVTISMTGKTESTPSTVPLTPSGLGQVRVTGKALKFTDVAAWLDAVNQVHGLTGPVLETAGKAAKDNGSGPGSGSGSSSADASTITYTSTAVIVPAALSHRYDRKAS
jgi:Tfp pilus assembly protein PilN